MTKEIALKCVIDSYTYVVCLVMRGYANVLITFQDRSNIALLLCEIRNDWVRINYELSPYQMQSAIQKFNTYNEDDVQNHFNQKRKENINNRIKNKKKAQLNINKRDIQSTAGNISTE